MIPVTYAGGIASLEDIEHFRKKTGGKVDFTIGSALDLFGGHLPYEQIKKYQYRIYAAQFATRMRENS